MIVTHYHSWNHVDHAQQWVTRFSVDSHDSGQFLKYMKTIFIQLQAMRFLYLLAIFFIGFYGSSIIKYAYDLYKNWSLQEQSTLMIDLLLVGALHGAFWFVEMLSYMWKVMHAKKKYGIFQDSWKDLLQFVISTHLLFFLAMFVIIGLISLGHIYKEPLIEWFPYLEEISKYYLYMYIFSIFYSYYIYGLIVRYFVQKSSKHQNNKSFLIFMTMACRQYLYCDGIPEKAFSPKFSISNEMWFIGKCFVIFFLIGHTMKSDLFLYLGFPEAANYVTMVFSIFVLYPIWPLIFSWKDEYKKFLISFYTATCRKA